MQKKNAVRMVVDLTMVALMPVLMAYSLVGETLHEVLGVLTFLLFLLHHACNFSWWKGFAKGHYTPSRVLMTGIDILLLIIMFLQPLSGIVMSKHLFTWLNPGISLQSARVIHLLSGHWGFVLMSIHLGFHLNGLKKRMHIEKLPGAVGISICLVFLIFGTRAFITRGMWGYLTLRTQFVFFDYSEPVIFFLADYLLIMGMFAVLGKLLLAGVDVCSKKNKEKSNLKK